MPRPRRSTSPRARQSRRARRRQLRHHPQRLRWNRLAAAARARRATSAMTAMLREQRVQQFGEARQYVVQRRANLHDGRRCTGGVCGGTAVTCTAQRPVPRRRHLQPGDGRLLESRTRPTARRATTATPARRPTPARPARACGANPVTCTASDQCHDAGTCNPATGVCSNPNASQRHGLQRRQRLHADRHLPGRRVHRRQPGDLHRDRPVPRRRHLQPATGVCSNPERGQRHRVQRRQRLHARPTPARRRVHRREPGHLHRAATSATTPAPATRRPASARTRPRPNGTACNDGNACTQTDTCQAGACTGAQPGHLHRAATSATSPAPATRRPASARTRPRPTAPPCNDGNACTQTDTCQAGACTGAQPRRLHRAATSATTPAPATRRPACARTRPRPTARPATTATPAPRPTPARPAPAPARTR